MAKPPTARSRLGRFVKSIFQGKGGRWFRRRKDGRTVFASKADIKKGEKLAKRRAKAEAKKEREAQKRARGKRRIRYLLQFRGAELRRVLREEKVAKRAKKKLEKSKANKLILKILRKFVPAAKWQDVEVRFDPQSAFIHRTWHAEQPIHYIDLLTALNGLRDGDLATKLAVEMANESMLWLNVEVTDEEAGHMIGSSGGHALSNAWYWELAVEQAISNPWTGAEALVRRYTQSLISSFSIAQYQKDPERSRTPPKRKAKRSEKRTKR